MEFAPFIAYVQKSSWNMMLFATAVVSGAMLLWPLLARLLGPGAKQVGALEAVQLINRRDALVLDVRESGEYAAGHLPNAKHIPASALAARLKDLEKFKGRPIVVTCASGARSTLTCGTLKKQGFEEVFALRGGIAAWEQAGMPVEKK